MAALLAFCLRVLARTWRVERPALSRALGGTAGVGEGGGRGYVVAILHGEQLPLAALHRDLPLACLVSLSRDGALAAGVLGRLGYNVIRGSTSRGGQEALTSARQALRAGRWPTIAVDGPRGPLGAVGPGAAALARWAGVPVLVVRADASGLRLRSWDRFLIPWPGARVRIRYAIWRGEGSLAAFIDATSR